MVIKFSGNSLKYQFIEAQLREQLQRLRPGDKLPSERALARTFGCNVLTVRRSLAILVDEGQIVRRTGSGTFVAPRELGDPLIQACLPRLDNRLGVLISHDSDAYGYNVTQAVALAAKRQAIDLRSAWVHGYGEEALALADMLKAGGCAALVLPWFPPQKTGEVEDFVRRSPLPVCIPQLIAGLEGNCFEQPSVFGKSMVTSTEGLCCYFRHLGHERIALLGPDSPGNPILQAKLTAYACHVSRAGLENLTGLVGETAEAVDGLARRWRPFRSQLAVISYDDTHALRFVTAMHKLGLSAPADFAIVGYNNIEASRSCDPPLTTVSQNFDYIGSGLITSALALARGTLDQSSEILPQRLVVRDSCGGKGRLADNWANSLPGLTIAAGTQAAPAPAVPAGWPEIIAEVQP